MRLKSSIIGEMERFKEYMMRAKMRIWQLKWFRV